MYYNNIWDLFYNQIYYAPINIRELLTTRKPSQIVFLTPLQTEIIPLK